MESGGLRERPSLRSKLKQRYDEMPIQNIFKPDPATANTAGKTFVWFTTISLLISLIAVVTNDVVHSYEWQRYTYVLILVIVFEMGLNWGLCAVIRDSCAYRPKEGEKAKFSNQTAWKYCVKCQHDAPPRSHHCKVCNMCILKRDHHCYFTGTCIGFYTQRYFVVWLFWVVVGHFFAAGLIFRYLEFRLSTWTQWIIIYTVYEAFVGIVDWTSLFLAIQLYVCIACALFGLMFLAWELLIITYGMTSYEAWKGIRRYSTGTIWQNFRKVFGKWWLLNFIFPTQFRPEGDPVYWLSEKIN